MASLVRPFIVSYHLPDGTKVAKGTPGARKKRSRSKVWYRQYKDPVSGKWKREALFKDKAASQIRLAELEKKAEMDAVTGGDPFEQHRKRPLAEHLAAFEKQA